ncbi:chemotaxis protein CheX [Petroclostridium sp. X23]|uniref:chemotaxis protein CheX n=1 Tax=Petroclostridium sp. X23 TaxID=3045146 RepID=UPI0024ADF344|nr:chemotaxis protein CheX [Petroclostridium sp. X23]WHH61357.1 chemotaxis protein CheX [Petroclostridium sp. X23]
MDERYVKPFTDSIAGIFSNFGFGEITTENIYKKDSFTCRYNLTTIIGLSGKIKGNIALSMPYETAKKIASNMMMGMEVPEIDEISVSALGEMTNMICGQAAVALSIQDLPIDITPPTIIHGDNMKAIISQVETIVVDISTSLGSIELNLGLEG